MRNALIITAAAALVLAGCSTARESVKDRSREKTSFQSNAPWKPVTDNRADIAMVYGTTDAPGMTFEQRVESWRTHGYNTHFMTGIAWGEYQDYFTGKWDGKPHLDEGQVTAAGDTLWHGYMVPYIVPTDNFIKYMKERQIKRVIDAGIDAIYLEEPEFWAHAGYSDAFKREWKTFYGFDWRPQHESAENTYLSNKLKYHLYYKALNEVFTFAKEYGKSKGMDVRCYVPTHSLVNYSAWSIVSPEASLASLPCVDGYISQVWTGTSRTPNYYGGVKKERVFENAFLEYGSMASMTEPTGRKLFFLTDPIEDYPRDWADYKINYQATFTAQLLYPAIANYEIMPWPDRIYEGLFLNPATGKKERISKEYSTQMQIMVNALGQMPVSENKVSGSDGIYVMMSNSLMFQRGAVHNGYEDPDFSNFYGQTLPLLKRGVPVRTMHLENTAYPETWKDAKVLVMSYSNMKPMDPAAHTHIASWVKEGGKLLFCGTDKDPYQDVLEWWNSEGNSYSAPSEHLFSLLGMPEDPDSGEYTCGKGQVTVIRTDPKDFVLTPDSDSAYIEAVKKLYESGDDRLVFKNSFYLERGPYEIAAVVDEGISGEPLVLDGKFIDLFSPELPVCDGYSVKPGTQAFLYDLGEISDRKSPHVLAAASCVEEEHLSGRNYSLLMKSPAETRNMMRVYFPSAPESVSVKDAAGNPMKFDYSWDQDSRTCLLGFDNSPEGVTVEFAM